MLIVMSGLPGTGKTTIARAFARRESFVYLRIDAIEHAICDRVSSKGYAVARVVAAANLAVGNRVMVDCVNPVAASRKAWSDVALEAGCRLFNVEIICSDQAQHRLRVETRVADIDGLDLPTWDSLAETRYQPWSQPRLVIDTALSGVEVAVMTLSAHICAANACPA